jgi:hypothetical protein
MSHPRRHGVHIAETATAVEDLRRSTLRVRGTDVRPEWKETQTWRDSHTGRMAGNEKESHR